MIHYTCDRCRRVINTEDELRFEVNIVTEIKLENGLPDDTAREQLETINDLLGHVVDAANDDEIFQTQRYDLCASCYKEYAGNPLGSEPQLQVEFSEN